MKYLKVEKMRKSKEYRKFIEKEMKPAWIIREGTALEYVKKNFPKNIRILDLGCGNGAFLKQLYDAGFKNLNFVDLGDYIVYPEIRSLNRLKITDLNMEKLPYEPDSFDLITAFQVLEHLENPFHFIRECHQVLKKKGMFVLSIPHGTNIQSRLHFLFTENIIGWNLNNNHISFLTKDVFTNIVLSYFKTEKILYSKGFIDLYLFGKKLRNLPRSKYLSRKVCYFLKKL